MATEVYNKQEIILQDGTEVTLKPLTLKYLRMFMKEWRRFGNPPVIEGASKEEQEEANQEHEYDMFLSVTAIALERELKEKVTKDAKDSAEADAAYREYLEEVLDMETIFKVIEVCAGMKLDDPNLLALAAQSLATEDGTN